MDFKFGPTVSARQVRSLVEKMKTGTIDVLDFSQVVNYHPTGMSDLCKALIVTAKKPSLRGILRSEFQKIVQAIPKYEPTSFRSEVRELICDDCQHPRSSCICEQKVQDAFMSNLFGVDGADEDEEYEDIQDEVGNLSN